MLIFFFSHRGFTNAEDLAHDTLEALWRRADYQFEKDEDFLQICHAFANRVRKAAFRKDRRIQTAELDEQQVVARYNASAINPAEMSVLLQEVLEAGRTELNTRDWGFIRKTVLEETGEPDREAPGEAASGEIPSDSQMNKGRVQHHRARERLKRLTGWKS